MIGEYRGEGVCVLTLSRPEKANALTSAMLQDLEARISDAAGDADLRALVLTGAGKVFSAGADLEAARAGLATDPVWERLSAAIASFPVLTIAALNGSAAGGSLGMVLACDLRVAVPGAKIFYPVMRLGFLPQPSDPARRLGDRRRSGRSKAFGRGQLRGQPRTCRGDEGDVLECQPCHLCRRLPGVLV